MLLLYLAVISAIYICVSQSTGLALSAGFVPAWSPVCFVRDHQKAAEKLPVTGGGVGR